ncbi:MAG: hypothetical protein WC763_00235 [Candidatus Paceibacterota bacterium]|jgi:hypothetical protein
MAHTKKAPSRRSHLIILGFISTLLLAGAAFAIADKSGKFTKEYEQVFKPPVLDKALYDLKLNQLAHIIVSTSTASTTIPGMILATSSATSTPAQKPTASTTPSLWPAKTVYPNVGALLPFNRIVAYYGNFYSKSMGVLGQYPPDVMLKMLMEEVSKWQLADPTTPVIPALNYIAVTAQGSAGEEGLYRLRMPDDQIQKAIDLANQVNGIVFLEIQVGQSTIEKELPVFDKYLALPNVHLALDPEFSMKMGRKPGIFIGTMDATEINWAIAHVGEIVRANGLPPKIVIIHRFTENMVTNYKSILPTPDVQVVMDMDGWGTARLKAKVYDMVITEEPVQFTGIKLFYKNDLKTPSTGLMTTKEVLDLMPQPSYIQYQ